MRMCSRGLQGLGHGDAAWPRRDSGSGPAARRGVDAGVLVAAMAWGMGSRETAGVF